MTAAGFSPCSNTELPIWAVIPARGGSKRLPRKNAMPFAGGDSLTVRTIHKAIESGCFSRVLLSTDDLQIAADGRAAGALVPFIRPADLSGDQASSVDVLLHAVAELAKLFAEEKPAAVALLQVTSPLLSASQIAAAVETFVDGGFNSLSSMVAVEQYPEWMFRVAENYLAIPESQAGIVCPTDRIPARYIENGAIYLVRYEWLAEHHSLYDFARHGCYAMPAEDSVDIDTRSDWDYAEFLLRRRA